MDKEFLKLLKDLGLSVEDFKAEYGGRLNRLEEQGDAIENALAISQAPGGGGVSTGRLSDFTDGKGYALLGPRDNKSYTSLFGKQDEHPWTDKENTFFQAVFSGRHHPGLVQASSMTEGVPGDGGFLVPTEQTAKIHAVSLENELVMPRAFLQPMRSNELKIPAMEIGDHGSNLYGGFTASYTAETGTISEKNPKTRQIDLKAKKLTGLLRFSNELVADIPGGEKQLVDICGRGLAWYRDKAFLKGSGAGTPLGILNADCTVEVSKEVGQDAATIHYQNLTNMMARMYAGSFANSVWVCHQTTIPQLLGLCIPVGTGGSYYQVLTEGKDGGFKLLTRPCIFTEKTEILGNKGDIGLFDFSQYVVGLREGMRFDLSAHVHFTTDELMARLIERHDGQPLWNEPLTLEDGSTTVSPFVVLAERA